MPVRVKFLVNGTQARKIRYCDQSSWLTLYLYSHWNLYSLFKGDGVCLTSMRYRQ